MSADTVNTAVNEVVEAAVPVSTERFLTFSSDGLNIGVSTNYVIEIITNHAITMVPLVPDYVKGIINLRGQIIPIIDIRLRMGKPSIEYTNTTCIIVLNINSVYIGIIVDAVQQVMDIDQSKISPVPVENQQELISGMISSSERSVILFLDCEQLVQTY
ncbi:MAG: purine-binding chemotaxis protein CheW [Dorea sp.]|jgi:purine-binding chemotaxis protein CheW|uniref:chemotaxis protein CheW n=1 Tax=Sporofaciens sp. JLR.KK001 TaxID=3112621 RepID=UPI00216F5DB1|nr:purine-binding chemotaxis protein CheW [Dorea sp.]